MMPARLLSAAWRGLTVILRREMWWAEFWSATVALIWSGLSYFGPPPLSHWPSMDVLLMLAREPFWDAASAALGMAQMTFLLFNARWLRWAAALLLCWFWGVLTIGVWVATPWAPAVAVYAGWCGINVFSILRLLRPVP